MTPASVRMEEQPVWLSLSEASPPSQGRQERALSTPRLHTHSNRHLTRRHFCSSPGCSSQMLIAAVCVPVAVPDSTGTEGGSPPGDGCRSPQLQRWPHCQLRGKESRSLAVIGSGKGFKLNDRFLLLPSTLNISTFWFICR